MFRLIKITVIFFGFAAISTFFLTRVSAQSCAEVGVFGAVCPTCPAAPLAPTCPNVITCAEENEQQCAICLTELPQTGTNVTPTPIIIEQQCTELTVLADPDVMNSVNLITINGEQAFSLENVILDNGVIKLVGSALPNKIISLLLEMPGTSPRNTMVVNAVSDADGHWSVTINDILTPGNYRVSAISKEANGKINEKLLATIAVPQIKAANTRPFPWIFVFMLSVWMLLLGFFVGRMSAKKKEDKDDQ